jgi:hypothetical protein
MITFAITGTGTATIVFLPIPVPRKQREHLFLFVVMRFVSQTLLTVNDSNTGSRV